MRVSLALGGERKKINSLDFIFVSHHKRFVFLFPLPSKTKKRIYFFIFATIQTKKKECMRDSLIHFLVQNIP